MDDLARPSLRHVCSLAIVAPLLAALACLPGGERDEGTWSTTAPTDPTDDPSDTEVWGDGEPTGDGEPWGDGDGDGDGDCELDCGEGSCVIVGFESYCECPEGTDWKPYSCDPCPVVDAQDYDLEIPVVEWQGTFLVSGSPTPQIEYDDANIWLENLRTGDRVFVGNTHDGAFAVRVTPGLYDVVYEVESAGATMPHNPRAVIAKIDLFTSRIIDVDIPVASVIGDVTLNGAPAPATEYDDALLLLRDRGTNTEVVLANSHDGSYATNVVAGDYDVVYRVESRGELMPHNDGASLATVPIDPGAFAFDIDVPSVPVQGEFTLNGVVPPANEYEDANIALESIYGGVIQLGNTHDGSFDVPALPGTYQVIYMHENGADVPQNQRARIAEIDVVGDPVAIDIPMVAISGSVTVNDAQAPQSEFDDGVLYLAGVDSDDLVILGNTHDGAYQVNVIPGEYDVLYSLETAGGTVPENTRARVAANILIDQSGVIDVDVPAVALSGTLTLAGAQPPSSVYEDGRIYLRGAANDDSLLLGSTHDGSYAALVVPGDYELFYTQEAGGSVPSNQDAMLGALSVIAPMVFDVDIPALELAGAVFVDGQPAPASASDSGRLYLRGPEGDTVLLGDSHALAYAAKLVSGTYGVYYRSVNSVTMPENDNGRFACITVE